MLRPIWWLVLALAACVPAAAQSACDKAESDTPVVRGFRLGMTVEELKPIYHIRDESDETGYFSARLGTLFLSEAQSQGVSQIDLGFLDHRLVSIIVLYDNSTKWENAEQFAAAISESLGVPRLWAAKTGQNNPGMAAFAALQVVCGRVTYAVGGREGISFETPLLAVFRNDTKPIRDVRRKDIEEKKRRSFKP